MPAGPGVSAVGVYPFVFRWEAPAWRAVELSQRLVDVALAEAGDAALFFGPTEVRVYRPEADDAWAASDAVAVLAPHGVRPEGALVPRPRAERRIQAGEREMVDSRGRTVGQGAHEAVTYLGTVEVLHPASRRVVLEVSGEAAADPFADVTDDGAAPPGAKLAAGDQVHSLDGRPALPQALARTRMTHVPIEARARQASGRIVSLLLP